MNNISPFEQVTCKRFTFSAITDLVQVFTNFYDFFKSSVVIQMCPPYSPVKHSDSSIVRDRFSKRTISRQMSELLLPLIFFGVSLETLLMFNYDMLYTA